MAAIVISTEGFDYVFALTDRLENPQWDLLLRRVGLQVMRQTVRHFQDQGGPEGAWTPRQDNNPWPILLHTGTLARSIGMVPVGNDAIAVGTDLTYGKFHQEGTRRMVRRMFLGLTSDDEAEVKDIVESYTQDLLA